MWHDGGIYDGCWMDGLFHGIGIYNLLISDGMLYKGEWARGKRHGLGTQLTPDYILKGTFANDMLDRSKTYILYTRSTFTTVLGVVKNVDGEGSLVKHVESGTLYFGLKGDDGNFSKDFIHCGYTKPTYHDETGEYFRKQLGVRSLKLAPSDFTNDYRLSIGDDDFLMDVLS